MICSCDHHRTCRACRGEATSGDANTIAAQRTELAALRADLARLRASSAALVSKYEERDAALRADLARLRAVADAARALVKCADDDTDDGQGPIVCRKHGGALRTALAALDLPATATGEKGTEHRG